MLRHKEDLDRAAALEKRVARIVRQYTVQVCAQFFHPPDGRPN